MTLLLMVRTLRGCHQLRYPVRYAGHQVASPRHVLRVAVLAGAPPARVPAQSCTPSRPSTPTPPARLGCSRHGSCPCGVRCASVPPTSFAGRRRTSRSSRSKRDGHPFHYGGAGTEAASGAAPASCERACGGGGSVRLLRLSADWQVNGRRPSLSWKRRGGSLK